MVLWFKEQSRCVQSQIFTLDFRLLGKAWWLSLLGNKLLVRIFIQVIDITNRQWLFVASALLDQAVWVLNLLLGLPFELKLFGVCKELSLFVLIAFTLQHLLILQQESETEGGSHIFL